MKYWRAILTAASNAETFPGRLNAALMILNL